MNRFEDLVNAIKLGELLNKKEEEKKQCNWVCIATVIGIMLAVAAIAIALYKHFTPDYLDDFEDDFDDDFDEESDQDFFEE